MGDIYSRKGPVRALNPLVAVSDVQNHPRKGNVAVSAAGKTIKPVRQQDAHRQTRGAVIRRATPRSSF